MNEPSTPVAARSTGSDLSMWTYRRAFRAGSQDALVVIRSTVAGLRSALRIDGIEVATDSTPASGAEAVRNHRLSATLADGRQLEVEAGYINWLNIGIAARIDGELVHESHPGRRIAMPERAARMMGETMADGRAAYDMGKLGESKYAIGVDIALGLLFFLVAKLTNLSTAALVGAGAGLALIVAQRFVKVDIIGGMALFGVFMLLVSAGFALAFQDDEIIKQRSTIVGLIGATAFLIDGALGGKRLGAGMSRYIAYRDIDPRRLALGMGTVAAVMALTNWLVVKLVSTNVWLFYTTFVDLFLAMGLALAAVQWSRRGGRPAAAL